MKHFKKLLSLLFVFVLLSTLIACGTTNQTSTSAPEANTKASKYGGTLTTGYAGTLNSLYSIMVPGQAQHYVYPAVESLGRLQLDGSYKPFLCESWERDNTALTLILHLHKGIKFSDGSDLTADVVKWNLEMMLKNGQSTAICNPKQIEVIDENTLRIYFKTFSLSWENSYGACYIYSKQTYDTKGENYAKIHPVGTGPFILNDYVPDSYLRFVRNTNYWQKGLPYLDNYNIEIMPDATTRQSSFVNKEISHVTTNESNIIKYLESLGYKNKAVDTASSVTTFFVVPSSTVKDDPFYNINVRKALMLYGVNWDAVTNACTEGYGKSQLQWYTKDAYGYNPDVEKESRYDPEKAKTMLKEAGYSDGFKTQIIYANPVYNTLGAALQDQLRNYNIAASVNLLTSAASMRQEGKPGIHLWVLRGTADTTLNFTTQFCRNGMFGKLCNYSDNYEAAISRIRNARTNQELSSAMKDANRIFFVDDCLGRNAYLFSNNMFINEGFHNTGFESSILTPEIAYLSK